MITQIQKSENNIGEETVQRLSLSVQSLQL